ncbi:MAG: CheR family methyltransferase [Promethearchaeota archaeon]
MSGLELINFDNIIIEESSYQRLIQLLSQETKLNFDFYRRNFIERRIKSRMIRVRCKTLDSYYDYILSNPDELEIFLASFNINYTYFFRNYDVFDRFQSLILECLNYQKSKILCDLNPNPIEIRKTENVPINRNDKKKSLVSRDFKDWRKNIPRLGLEKQIVSITPQVNHEKINSFLKQTSLYQKINTPKFSRKPVYIWSCACATGEEPYSIAMLLNNLKKQIPNFPYFKLVASDIDKTAIERAKIGIYNEQSTKEMSKYFEYTYFTKTENNFGSRYVISNEIKNKIEFIQEDVTKGHVKKWKYDIIFCRYLLIYINRENRNKFLKVIENRLKPGGLLILGKTETLLRLNNHFKLVDGKSHIYMKTNLSKI